MGERWGAAWVPHLFVSSGCYQQEGFPGTPTGNSGQKLQGSSQLSHPHTLRPGDPNNQLTHAWSPPGWGWRGREDPLPTWRGSSRHPPHSPDEEAKRNSVPHLLAGELGSPGPSLPDPLPTIQLPPWVSAQDPKRLAALSGADSTTTSRAAGTGPRKKTWFLCQPLPGTRHDCPIVGHIDKLQPPPRSPQPPPCARAARHSPQVRRGPITCAQPGHRTIGRGATAPAPSFLVWGQF